MVRLPIDDLEPLANDGHPWLRRSPNAVALSAKAGLMSPAPLAEGSVAFAFSCRELLGYVFKCDDVNALGFDHAERVAGEVVTTLR